MNLFVYGSLCFPKVVEKLTGEVFNSVPAVLNGFQRRKVKQSDYPAIIKNKNSQVEGFLLRNINDKTMQILTFYEGNEYLKEEVFVETGTEEEKAYVFIWNNSLAYLENEDWNSETFEKNSLQVYLDKVIPETIDEFKRFNHSE